VFDSGLQWPAWTTAIAPAPSSAPMDHHAAAPAADWQRLLAGLPWQTAPGA